MTKNDANGLIADLIAARKPGFALDQAFYSDPSVYARDIERVFMREWLYAGHASEIPKPGDYFLFEVAGESVIVVRGDDRVRRWPGRPPMRCQRRVRWRRC